MKQITEETPKPQMKPERKPKKKVAKARRPIKASEEWVELFPSGVSVGSDVGRPVLILKDRKGDDVLPVWMQPLDAGVALAGLSQTSGLTPHKVTRKLLSQLGVKIESCSFVDLVGHHQFVLLRYFTKQAAEDSGALLTEQTLRVRADDAMSFCLEMGTRFFGTKSYMARCRDLDVDIAKFEQSLLQGDVPGLSAEMEKSSKKHPYVM